MPDDAPRTAYEIALARLKEKDRESGVVDQPPTEEQKTAIAEARSVHASKVAELEILHRSQMARMFDPADRQRLEEEYRDELRRLNDDCERKVRKIRQQVGD
jgi:hypothetical protein